MLTPRMGTGGGTTAGATRPAPPPPAGGRPRIRRPCSRRRLPALSLPNGPALSLPNGPALSLSNGPQVEEELAVPPRAEERRGREAVNAQAGLHAPGGER